MVLDGMIRLKPSFFGPLCQEQRTSVFEQSFENALTNECSIAIIRT